MKKTIEIDTDEIIAKEIKTLKAKITRLENKLAEYKIKSVKVLDLHKFTKANRDEVLSAANNLVNKLKHNNWVAIDEYWEYDDRF